MNYANRITFDPEQCGGRPCIRHYRIRVKDVLDMMAAGVSEGESAEVGAILGVGGWLGFTVVQAAKNQSDRMDARCIPDLEYRFRIYPSLS